MYITLCGRPPFFGRTESAVFGNIMKAKTRLDENFKRDPWPKISPEAKDLITKMLNGTFSCTQARKHASTRARTPNFTLKEEEKKQMNVPRIHTLRRLPSLPI